MTGPVVVDRRDGVAEIRLNRPHRRNALSVPAIEGLRAAFEAATREPDVAAVVLSGAEGHFCSGLDTKDIDLTDPPTTAWLRTHEALDDVDVPVIAALTGAAVNAGAALALGCDLLISGEHAYLHIMEAAIGMAPPMNAAWLAARYPASVGNQLALSCRRFHGPDLLRLGVALEVVPDDRVRATALDLAATLAGFPGRGATVAKRALKAARGRDGQFASAAEAALTGGSR